MISYLKSAFAALLAAMILVLPAAAAPQVTGDQNQFKATLDTKASKDALYALWSTPSSWPSWDPQVSKVKFDGDVKVGAKGKMKGSGGPENTFEILEAVPGERFTYRISSAIGKVTFRRYFEPGDTVRFTHEVEFKGGMLSSLLSKRFQEGLPAAMVNLSTQAEADKTK